MDKAPAGKASSLEPWRDGFEAMQGQGCSETGVTDCSHGEKGTCAVGSARGRVIGERRVVECRPGGARRGAINRLRHQTGY